MEEADKMTEIESTKQKRRILFDQPVKMVLLFFHFMGFSGWFGCVVTGSEVWILFSIMTTLSGVLLAIRELYKDGFIWLAVTEGSLTLLKAALLAMAAVLKGYEVSLFTVVMLCGLLSSHLPKEIRERRLF